MLKDKLNKKLVDIIVDNNYDIQSVKSSINNLSHEERDSFIDFKLDLDSMTMEMFSIKFSFKIKSSDVYDDRYVITLYLPGKVNLFGLFEFKYEKEFYYTHIDFNFLINDNVFEKKIKEMLLDNQSSVIYSLFYNMLVKHIVLELFQENKKNIFSK